MFADAFNLFLIYSKIEPERVVDLRCVHVCLWPPASERTRQRKKQKRKKRVWGRRQPHSYRLSQKNTGEDVIFFRFLFVLFRF